MIPGEKDIEFVRGDFYERFGRVRTKVWDAQAQTWVPGSYRDITGWTGICQVRETVDSETVLFSFTVTLGNQTTAPGSFFIRALPAVTQGLEVLTGVYDLQWTLPDAKVYTYVTGKVTLKKDVSR